MTAPRAACVAVVTLVLLVGVSAGSAGQSPRGLLQRVPQGCVIETRAMSFGEYDAVAATAVDGQGAITYTCGVAVAGAKQGVKNIRIEMSRGSSNSYDRSMRAGAERLNYNVYLDASHRTVWGDGSNGTDTYFDPHPPNKQPVTVPAYGRIFAMQDVAAGSYFDILQVTILF